MKRLGSMKHFLLCHEDISSFISHISVSRSVDTIPRLLSHTKPREEKNPNVLPLHPGMRCNPPFSQFSKHLQRFFQCPIHCAQPRPRQISHMNMMLKVKLIHKLHEHIILNQFTHQRYLNRRRVNIHLYHNQIILCKTLHDGMQWIQIVTPFPRHTGIDPMIGRDILLRESIVDSSGIFGCDFESVNMIKDESHLFVKFKKRNHGTLRPLEIERCTHVY
mmetsp:Transcript_23228/g.39715  ORF Transcript_23228/g.39715 Transcript_23228/m.39715 type:complete len:219 (+) Transcript_23228:207-863(+)